MGIGKAWRSWVALTALCAVAAGLTASPAPAAHFAAAVSPQYDRAHKVALLEALPAPPELVIFGGSRAERFEPSFAAKLIGLPAFNFAVQNSRPEDVYAMSRLMFGRAPSVKLRCIWALQASTMSDSPLHPGLLAEPELTRFLPAHFVGAQRRISQPTKGRELQIGDEYSARGRLVRNNYDLRFESGVSLATALSGYLSKTVPKAAAPAPYEQTRAKGYFERTLQLFNLHGVEPVLVIMPYHPDALAAFRASGWGAKEEAFKTYLSGLSDRYRFRLVDYTQIAAFHGTPDGFYDGAHITAANARRILVQILKDQPDAFR